MEIAYINQDFPPEVGAGPARVLEMSLHWQRLGARVTVITGMPNRRLPDLADGRIHPDYRGRWFVEEEWEGLRVLRSWLYTSPTRSFARSLTNNVSFMLTSMARALSASGRYDVVIASSPPFLSHVTGEALRRAKRIPLVLEIRDLWPDYLIDSGTLKAPPLQRSVLGLERYLLRRAAHTVVVTESFRRRIAAKGIDAERISVIPNGVDYHRYRRVREEPPFPTMVRRPGEFIVGYLGTFGIGQRLRTVVEAARRLRDIAPEIRFVLAGDGADKAEIEARAAEWRLENLSIHPPIGKESTRAFYNACDLCLVPLAPLPIFADTVPSKLFEIMACERPVLASVSGEAARIVDSSGAGVVVPPGDPDELAEAILCVRGLDERDRAEMGRNGRTHVCLNYSREVLAERYLDILQDITHSDAGPTCAPTDPIGGRALNRALETKHARV
jgi:colanic acid biosynthesis glycosyl transferase WcaI